MSKVSIVIPVYNMAQYLPEALDSVLRQTHRDIEAICVDDGSTDESPAILERYAKADPRVRTIRQANSGSGTARNNGIAASAGEYLMFLDPDDFYADDDVVRKLHDAIQESGLNIARGRMVTVLPDGSRADDVVRADWPPAGKFPYRRFQVASGFTVAIYRRDLIVSNKIEFPSFRRFQDPPFHIRAMVAAGEFMQINDVVYWHRRGYRKLDWKGNGGFLLKEQEEGFLESIELARRNGLDMLLDLLLLMSGRRRLDWRARLVQHLCRAGRKPARLPLPDELNNYFDGLLAGTRDVATLFTMIRRVMTASPHLRREPRRILLARMMEAYRSGRISVRGCGRRRGLLLALMLLEARFVKPPAKEGGVART